MTISAAQGAVCQRYGSPAVATPAHTRIGLALTSCGERSAAEDFYHSQHAAGDLNKRLLRLIIWPPCGCQSASDTT